MPSSQRGRLLRGAVERPEPLGQQSPLTPDALRGLQGACSEQGEAALLVGGIRRGRNGAASATPTVPAQGD